MCVCVMHTVTCKVFTLILSNSNVIMINAIFDYLLILLYYRYGQLTYI